MIIRSLRSSDIASCAEIVRLNWSDEIATEARVELSLAERIPELEANYYVAFAKGHLVAFAGFRRTWKMRHGYEFTWVNVRPDFQGSGIGSELTQMRLAEVEKRGATAVSLTTRIPKWFRRFGFKVAYKYVPGGWTDMVKQLRDVGL